MTRRLAGLAVVTLTALSTPTSAKPAACHAKRSSIETMVRVDAHTLRLCWQSPDRCFTLDLDTKSPAWTPAAYPKSSPEFGLGPPIPGVTVGMTVGVCSTSGTDCRDFVVPPGPVTTFSDTYAIANADRSVIAAVSGRTITLFDGKGARRGTITSWKPEVGIGWSFENLSVYSDRVWVQMSAGDEAETRVFDTSGTQIAELAGGGGVSRAGPLQLADGTFAIATAFGEKLDVRDMSGKRIKLVDVFGPLNSPQLSDRAEQLVLGPGNHVAVARGDGSVALVDVTNGTHSVLPPPPECK